MAKIKFTKMVASGNDFLIVRPCAPPPVRPWEKLAQKICNRKFGVGADGLLVLEKSKIADMRMRIFNADGSEAKMCGNGARCAALYMRSRLKIGRPKLKIETKAGIIHAEVKGAGVKIKLTEPKNIKLGLPIKVNQRNLRVNFIDTGVPHTVIFVHGLDKIDVFNLGRVIRYHQSFAPRGTNVNFVEVAKKNSLYIRTYERGVEDETLACGTGSAAAALILAQKTNSGNKIFVHTRGQERLTVYFRKIGNKFSDVWLEGKASIVFIGELVY